MLRTVVTLEPAPELDAGLGIAVELGAVAGGDDDALPHRLVATQVAERGGQPLGHKHHALADLEGRGPVVDTDDEQGHEGRERWEAAGILKHEPQAGKRRRSRAARLGYSAPDALPGRLFRRQTSRGPSALGHRRD